MLSTRDISVIVVSAMLGTGACPVLAQNYPVKPVRIVTGGAGGSSDFQARQIAQGIAGPLGQPVIVDNRGGGLLPAGYAARALPDGYTLLLNGGSTWVTPLLQKGAPYDVVNDFSALSLISRDVNVVVVHPSVPVKSIQELIAFAKAKPGTLSYATGSVGSTGHLATELLRHMAGIDMLWVPYKGSAPAVTAVVSGEAQMLTLDAGLLIPLARSGKLRALAVTSLEPSVLAPGLPTVAAAGLPGYEAVGMTGMWTPVKTSTAIINRLNQEIVRFLSSPQAKESFLSVGAETAGTSPEQFGALVKADIARITRLIKDAGIKAN
jgi:tripartite-type tricarboxylate transporter receptor subunit TctC